MSAVKEDLPNHTSGPSNHDRFPQETVILNVHKSEEYMFAVKYNLTQRSTVPGTEL